jgi:hypothetical protein
MEFNLSGRITFDDFVSFNNYYFKYNLFNGWRKIVYPLLLLFLICAVIFIREYYLIMFIPIFIIIFCIFFKRILKKHYYSNKFFTEEQHYLITKDRIEIKTENSSAIITKDKINKIWYNKNAIYIFISSYLAYLIPETFFPNNEFDLLKDFINENYKKQPNGT